MNQEQVARQIEHLLENRKWGDDDAASVVFGKVVISPLSLEELIGLGIRQPFAAVRLGSERYDADWPEIVSAMEVTVDVCAKILNDGYGRASLVGGVRTDLTKSRGRGVAELMTEVKEEIARLEGEGGISVLTTATSASRAVRVGGSLYASQGITLSTRGTRSPFYHPARALANSGGTLTWQLPPDRWDRTRLVLRFAAGSTPPASVTAGTGASLSSDLATTFDHAAGSGTFSYALFAQYDPVGAANEDQYQTSAAVTLTDSF